MSLAWPPVQRRAKATRESGKQRQCGRFSEFITSAGTLVAGTVWGVREREQPSAVVLVFRLTCGGNYLPPTARMHDRVAVCTTALRCRCRRVWLTCVCRVTPGVCSRYLYEQFYWHKAISRELYDWCLREARRVAFVPSNGPFAPPLSIAISLQRVGVGCLIA